MNLNEFAIALKQKLGILPDQPGVYLFKDCDGKVIYVGKARNLKNRVKNYFGVGDGRLQLPALMERVCDLETIITLDEEQALMLERDLIVKFKPRYNIKLRDDKGFLSIRIDESQQWPRLELVRRTANDDARYFGPYSYGYELRALLEIVKSVVPLRSCSDAVLYNRQRPCLEYQIKRCCAPCCLAVEPSQYRDYLKQAIKILTGRTEELRENLAKQMEHASSELRFEDAAVLRDRLEVLERVRSSQRIFSVGSEDRDVFSLYREEQLGVLSVMQVRNARIAGSKSFTFTDLVIPDAEVIASAISQYYSEGRDIPPEIIIALSFEGLEATAKMLQGIAGHKVEILAPQRGSRAKLLELAALNAKQHFVTCFDSDRRYLELATAIAQKFKLRQMPRRVECIDISNFQGAETVGACVAFFDGEPKKQLYKRYKLSQSGKPDDFASIAEVVTRRVRGGIERGDLPDLLVIDGGPPQLREARRVIEESKIVLDVIALAKERVVVPGTQQRRRPVKSIRADGAPQKPERIFLTPESEPIELEAGTPITNFFVRLRDETHRFVINYHRFRREKLVTQSELDKIPGLSPERKRRLLKHFGGIKGIKSAAVEEIARVGKFPAALAVRMLERL